MRWKKVRKMDKSGKNKKIEQKMENCCKNLKIVVKN